MAPCGPVDVAYCLIYVTDSNGQNNMDGAVSPKFYTMYGESVLTYHVVIDNMVACYADLSHVSRYTPKIMATTGAMISGNFRCGINELNHYDHYAVNTELPTVNNGDINEHQMLGIIDELPVTRITADHHLFVNTNEIRAMLKTARWQADWKERAEAIRLMVDERDSHGCDNKVSMITHIMYALCAPLFALRHLMWIWCVCDDNEEYKAKLKLESQAAKQMQSLFRDDLSTIFELQVLHNRAFDMVDWDKEIKNREVPNTVPISSDQVYTIAKRIFSDAKNEGAKARRLEWNQYWQGRWSSMPGGSVVSQYDDDRLLKSELPREGRIKSAWFASNTNSDYNYWHSREPQMYASTSTKYEWGKVRALYGCDVTSFLHSDFAMGNCEDMLPSYFPVGKRANSKYVNKIIKRFSNGVPLCFDYDDFNSQHSTESMVAVMQAWKSVFAGRLSDEQYKSLEWTVKSLEDVKIRYNDISEIHRAHGTLLSGWRLTSFMNSVLNRVYLEHAGLNDNVIYALHNGDDMFATTQNVLQAVNLVRQAKHKGIRAQITKTNIGTIGEFLRVDTRATNPKGSQYLARAVATAVHGRVETGAPNDMRELYNAIITRTDALLDRGGLKAIIRTLVKQQMSFITKLFDAGEDIVKWMKRLHPIQGGVNEEAAIAKYKLVQQRQDVPEALEKQLQMIKPGIDDYVKLIVDRFKLDRALVPNSTVRKNAIRTLVRVQRRYKLVIEDRRNMNTYRGLYKAHKGSDTILPVAKLRSVNMATATQLAKLTDSVAQMISNSRDPLMMMSTVF